MPSDQTVILLTTDNGWVVRVDSLGSGTWSTSYESGGDHTFQNDIIKSIWVKLADPTNVYFGDNSGFTSILSTDSGGTWSTVGAFSSAPPFSADNKPFEMDEDGYLYGVDFPSGTSTVIYKSDNPNDISVFTPLVTFVGVTSLFSMEIHSGIIWGLAFKNPSTRTLLKVNTDGTGATTFDVPTGIADLYPSSHNGGNIDGWFGATEIYSHSIVEGDVAVESSMNVVVIDISTPTAPVGTLITAPFTPRYPMYVQALSNNRAVALAQAGDISNGELWYTDDSGSSWTKVVDTTTHLGGIRHTSPRQAPPYWGSRFITTDIDNDIVVAATLFPYIFVSCDGGLTWNEYTCPLVLGASDWITCGLTYSTSTIPIPCTELDFKAQCGDIFAGMSPSDASCVLIECWREKVRIGRIALTGSFLDQMNTMCFDKSHYLYVPFFNGINYTPNVLRFGDGNKNYTSTYTTWWTTPVANEVPISVSVDRYNRLYILVLGGATPSYSSATYLRLYKLDTSANILAVFDLGVTIPHSPSGALGGAYVDRSGARYLYTYNDDNSGVVSAFDLINNVQLPDLYIDALGTSFFPAGGLRVLIDNDRIVITNFATAVSLMREFASDGSSYIEYDGGFVYGGGDLEIEQNQDHIVISDGFGAIHSDPFGNSVLRLVRSTNNVSKVFSVPFSFPNNIVLAVLCGARLNNASSFVTLIGAT